jgi:hypothetical protein
MDGVVVSAGRLDSVVVSCTCVQYVARSTLLRLGVTWEVWAKMKAMIDVCRKMSAAL